VVAQQPFDGALHQGVKGADQLVHRGPAGLRLRDGDLLDGVLQVGARRLELLHEVGPVQQFEGGGVVARQPLIQQTADPLAGVQAVEVLRRDAQGLCVGRSGDLAGRLLRAHAEDRHRLELARILAERLLADLGGGDFAIVMQRLGVLQGAGSILHRHFQRPARAGTFANKNLEMHARHTHVNSPPSAHRFAEQA
jgi:hypothetical protein